MSNDLPEGKTLSADDYADRHDEAVGFESVCLRARQQSNLRHLLRWRPRRVLEVSCGPDLLCAQALPYLPELEAWVIVEPAQRYADSARLHARRDERLLVVQEYMENAGDAVRAAGNMVPFDAVLLSSVLHETAEPLALLQAAAEQLAPGGRLLANVPNARSFHRLLAVALGLTARPGELSARNQLLGQPFVFDHQALTDLMTHAGLREEAFEGYLFKPFTHDQMAAVISWLGTRGAQALIELGRQFPEHAAEICVVAVHDGGATGSDARC